MFRVFGINLERDHKTNTNSFIHERNDHSHLKRMEKSSMSLQNQLLKWNCYVFSR